MIVPEIAPEWGLGGLALSAFLSATLLPGGSEILLVLLARQQEWTPATLLWTAALANTPGRVVDLRSRSSGGCGAHASEPGCR
jgi:membrane protein YqaA with SNARE-associated domain